jgi:tetratricopeptide (TPR) repeat protein
MPRCARAVCIESCQTSRSFGHCVVSRESWRADALPASQARASANTSAKPDSPAGEEAHTGPPQPGAASASDPAAAAKAAGTRKFKEGDFQRAALNYSLALRLLGGAAPEMAAVLSNRSAAYATLGKWESALEDAERAVKLDGTCAKYWCRKGAALVGLGQAGEAVKVYKQAAKVDPGYAGAREGLSAAQEAILSAQRRYADMWGPGGQKNQRD